MVYLIVIELTEREKQIARQLAQQTYEKYGAREGHYRNLLSSHLVGRMGEIAALEFFGSNNLNPVAKFHDPQFDNECDIVTRAGRCEVKTWSYDYWETYGRCVDVS